MDLQSPLYQPLREGEVRLLHVQPYSNPDNPEDIGEDIHGVLKTVSIDAAPQYIALSYEWDGPDPEIHFVDCYVNSQRTALKVNLVCALFYLRARRTPFPLWIDALCINQHDLEERNRQVRMMTQIYQNATGVIAWLGREDGSSSSAMELLNELDTDLQERRVSVDTMNEWIAYRLFEPSYKVKWEGLCVLLQRSYWKRLWIIQELTVAREAVLLCGWDTADLSRLRLITLVIHRLHLRLVFDYSDISRQVTEAGWRFMKMERILLAWQSRHRNGERLQLLPLLQHSSENLCTDPRDKVYAMLGMVPTYNDEELNIDYSVLTADVFINAAKYIVRSSHSLEILIHCRREFNPNFSLPSWVPDWMKYSDDLRVVIANPERSSACSNRGAAISFSPNGKELTVKAIMLGSLTAVAGSTHWTTIPAVQSIMRSWISLAAAALSLSSSVAGPSNRTPDAHIHSIMYETLFYSRHGEARARRAWPPANFPGALFSFDLERDIENTQIRDPNPVDMLAMLRGVIRPSVSLFGLALDGTQDGSTIGMCSSQARIGDKIAVILGCQYPIALRLREPGSYEVLGDAYVHGFMTGRGVENGNEVDITLV
jgi:hypothetical protein